MKFALIALVGLAASVRINDDLLCKGTAAQIKACKDAQNTYATTAATAYAANKAVADGDAATGEAETAAAAAAWTKADNAGLAKREAAVAAADHAPKPEALRTHIQWVKICSSI